VQYELDGVTETHDPQVSSTTSCPFLPGQKVNKLWVPHERSNRTRSASTNSLRSTDLKTMDPEHKFVTPRPPPPVPAASASTPSCSRLGSAPSALRHVRSARSLSPSPAWPWSPRRLFTRKTSSRQGDYDDASEDGSGVLYMRPASPASSGSRSRSISPESLRRFLVDDDVPSSDSSTAATGATPAPSVFIPEDIVEEAEDDDNFASSAQSESMLYTGLSPPPLQRGNSSGTILQLPSADATPEAPTRAPPAPPADVDDDFLGAAPSSRFSISSASTISSPVSPASPTGVDAGLSAFFSAAADDDDAVGLDAFPFPPAPTLRSAFTGYALPREDEGKTDFGSLVGELGWMAGAIDGKTGA
jgi:hypothetical protein